MADVITRFKLETTQFDSKLRDESRRLTDLTKHLQLAGNDFNKFAANSVESARALGQLSTGTDNAAQSLKVLVKAYNDVANAYNALTEEQKKGDFGKAMAESLQQLQGRITQTKNELNSTGGVLSQLADKFVVNIDAMKLFSAGLSVAKGALGVVKDAFFASEANIDEWGRTLQSGQILYESFLTALNTGDVSGFLNNIASIEKAAREAYNALDYLYTMKTINAPGTSARQAEITRMQTMLRTGRSVASLTGGTNYGEEGTVLSQAQRQQVADELKRLMQDARDVATQEIKAANDAIDKLYVQQAKTLGMSADEFRRGTANMEEFNKKMAGARAYLEFEANRTTSVSMSTSFGTYNAPVSNRAANPNQQYAAWAAFKDDGKLYQQIVSEIRNRDAAQGQYYSLVGQSYRGINRAEGISVRGGSGGGSKEVTIQQQIAALEREAVTATAERQEEIRATIQLLDQELARQKEIVASMHGGSSDMVNDFWKAVDRGDPNASFGIPTSTKVPQGMVKPGDLKKWEDYYAAIEKPLSPLREMEAEAARLKEAMADAASPEQYQQLNAELSAVVEKMSKFKGETVVKAGEDATESWRAAASAIQSVGSALGSIEDPAAKVAGLIAQAIAQVAATFAASLKGTFTPWDWIAGAAAGTATMISTIAAIKSATAGSYAEGGIVPGRSFTGDNLTANVNSGEVILSVAQANTIASILQGGGSQQSGGGTPYVTGETVILGINNTLRRQGRGEIVTTGTLRRLGIM